MPDRTLVDRNAIEDELLELLKEFSFSSALGWVLKCELAVVAAVVSAYNDVPATAVDDRIVGELRLFIEARALPAGNLWKAAAAELRKSYEEDLRSGVPHRVRRAEDTLKTLNRVEGPDAVEGLMFKLIRQNGHTYTAVTDEHGRAVFTDIHLGDRFRIECIPHSR